MGYPTFFNLSVEKNLRLKVDFFCTELRGTPQDVREAVVGTPTLLGYSLTKRILPRLQVMNLLGVKPNFTDHRWHLTSYTNLRFKRWAERQVVDQTGAHGRADAEVRSRMKAFAEVLHGNAHAK